ncbi:MAG: PAS domain S-box protein [Anaerolineaceae bacterium]|nr:PAS domain S-box protein [Anaerolineaceae bacterium]
MAFNTKTMVVKNSKEKRSNNDLERIRELEHKLRESREIIKKLKGSEEKYRSIIEYAPDGVFISDEKGKYIEVNPAACRITGYSKEELLKLSIPEILLPEDLDLGLKHFRDVTDEESARGTTRFVTKKGEIRFWDVAAVKLSETRFLGFVKDVTEKKKAEDKLKEQSSLVRIAADKSKLGGWNVLLNENRSYWSDEVAAIHEMPPGYAPLVEDGINFYAPEWHDRITKVFTDCVQKGVSYDEEMEIITSTGKRVWIRTIGEAVRDENGNIYKVQGAFQDISEKKAAEAKIREKDLQFRKLSANVPDLLYQFTRRPDGSYYVPIASEGIINIFGCRPEDVADNFDAISRVLHPDDAERVIADIEYSARHLTYFTCEFRVLIPGRPVQWILSRSTPEKLPDGSVTWYGFNANITERKQSEDALKESETGLREAQRLANIGNWSWNLKKDELYLSDEMYNIIGIEKNEEALDISSHKKYYTNESWEKFNTAIDTAIRSGESYEIELEVVRPKGANREAVARGEVFYDSDNKVETISGTLQDITSRKRAEMIKQLQYNIALATITTRNLSDLVEALKIELNKVIDTKNLFIALYNEKTGMIHSPFFQDEKDSFREWNAEKSLTGYLIKNNRSLLLHKNEILRLHKKGIIDLRGTVPEVWMGVPLRVEERIFGAIVFQDYNTPEFFDRSSLEILELAAHELSLFIDRQNAEEKANKLSRAVEQSSVAVVITNREGSIEYINPFFTELTGYSFDEVKGKKSNILKSGHQNNEFYQKLWEVILSGDNWEGEFLNKKKSGELYWSQATISPILNSDRIITNFISIHEDITERKKMVEDLIDAKEKAQQSDRLKSSFLANMSHEIRTPMNGILGFLELLSEPDLGEDVKAGYLDIVKKSGQRLLSTINDIIEISKIESGDMQLCSQEINVSQFLSYYYDFFLPQAKGKGLQLEFVQCKTDTETIFTDKSKLDSILTNLIKNAIKFTEKGRIEFGCEQKDSHTLLFYIKDTGKGIDPDKIDQVFERFMQADNLNTRGYEGSGLGLSITKAYVEHLGGKIWVESEPGKGSCFYFTIRPSEREDTDTAKTENEVENTRLLPKKLKLLIAEDDTISFMFLEAILKTYQFEITRCVTGLEAVQYCRSNPDIDLILMDIGMPVMDGYEATRRIREFNKNVVIIAQTAFAISSDSEKVKEAGCNDYLPKPINKEHLFELIQKYFRQ